MVVDILVTSLITWACAVGAALVAGRFVHTKAGPVAAGAVGAVFAYGQAGLLFWVIALAPFWVTIVIVFVIQSTVGNIELFLSKRGYLGKQKQWMYELMGEKNREYEAAKTLLSSDKMSELAEVSSSKRDFRENVINAAGIEDAEEKSVNEAIRRD